MLDAEIFLKNSIHFSGVKAGLGLWSKVFQAEWKYLFLLLFQQEETNNYVASSIFITLWKPCLIRTTTSIYWYIYPASELIITRGPRFMMLKNVLPDIYRYLYKSSFLKFHKNCSITTISWSWLINFYPLIYGLFFSLFSFKWQESFCSFIQEIDLCPIS